MLLGSSLFLAGAQTPQIHQAPTPADNQVKYSVVSKPDTHLNFLISYSVGQVYPNCNVAGGMGVNLYHENGDAELLQTGVMGFGVGGKPFNTWDGNKLSVSYEAARGYSTPDQRFTFRVDLGPNLVFADGTQTRTATLAPNTSTSMMYFRRGGSVNASCDKAPSTATSPSPTPVPTLPSSYAVPCPHLQEIREGVREINRLASRLELDDSYYRDAVEDMLAAGYNSEFARLGFTGDAASIVQAFSSPSRAQVSKASMLTNTRDKAQFRQQLATAMYAYSQGQPYQSPAGGNGITDSVAGYLCSADPAKMDIASWDALYNAGYIASPLHKNVRMQMKSNAILGPIVLAATVIDAAPLAVGILSVGGRAFAVDAGEIGVLKALAKKDLAFETPRTFSTIEQRLTGKELNAMKFSGEGEYPPFLEDAPAYRASTNEEVKLVRFYRADRANKIRSWLVRKDLVVDTEGNYLSAKEIQNVLALDKAPNLVCDVTVPPNTEFWVGTAAPQSSLGGKGLTEQFYIDRESLYSLKFGDGKPLAK
jgi:hypothetical protein